MADSTNYGLLTNMASGIREAMNTYSTLKNQNRQQKLAELQAGVQVGDNGEYEFTPEMQQKKSFDKAVQQAGLLKSGYEPVLDSTGNYSVKPVEGYKDEEKDLKLAQAEYYRAKARETALPGKPEPTKGQTSADAAYAKDYNDWVAQGGKATAQKALSNLNSAIADLEKSPNQKAKAGGISGLLGNSVMDIYNPQASATRDKIYSAIQSTLKAVLGGQYTEKEGEAVFNRAYNPRLPIEENVRRATVEMNALQSMADSKNAAAKYFEKNGTITGWEGTSLGENRPLDAQKTAKTKVKSGLLKAIEPNAAQAGTKSGPTPLESEKLLKEFGL